MNWLISYPRSGSNWLRYCIEVLSRRPVRGLRYANGEQEKGLLAEGVNYIMAKDHIWQTGEKVILLVRDYKECIPRHKKDNSFQSLEADTLYLNLIHRFNSHKGDKMIVYYEDLLDDLEYVLYQVSAFLGIENKVEQFLASEAYHRQKSLELYGQSVSGGFTIHFHCENIDVRKWDNYMQSMNIKILNRYDN